jgi:hypothetical protein
MNIRNGRTLAAAAALLLAGAGAQALAQQPPASPPPAAQPPAQAAPAPAPDARGSRVMSEADRAAFLSARLAAVRAGLALTSDQDKLWPAAETAVRDAAKLHADLHDKMRGVGRDEDPVVRMRRMADLAVARGEAMRKVADGVGPLYASLNDEQKRRLRVLTRGGMAGLGMGGMGMGMGAMGSGGMRDGMMGRGDHRHGGRHGDHHRDHRGMRGHHHDHHPGEGYRRGGWRDGALRRDDLRQGADWNAPNGGFDRGGWLDDWRSL